MHGDVRTPERIKVHYELERRLSDRLRHAGTAERAGLYSRVYDELFATLPDHEQLQRKTSPEMTEREAKRQFGILKPFIHGRMTFCEIGAGDGHLSRKVAGKVERVFAIDVARCIMDEAAKPENMQTIVSDGISIPVPRDSVHVIYSNQLMEHIHTDDARHHIAKAREVLRPGGRYICVTPNRLSGPHDISRYFDNVATCFHLREYTNKELREEFRMAGFSRFGVIVSWQFFVVPMTLPLWPVIVLEAILGVLPKALRRPLAHPLGAIKFVGIR